MDPNIIVSGINGLSAIVSGIISSRKTSENETCITVEQMLEMQQKLISVQRETYKILDENHELSKQIQELKAKLEEQRSIIRHKQNYITLKDDPQEIKYCSVCYGKEKKYIQLDDNEKEDGTVFCPSCKTQFTVDRDRFRRYCEYLNKKNSYDSFGYSI